MSIKPEKMQDAWISFLWINPSGEVNYLECLPLSILLARAHQLKDQPVTMQLFGIFEDKIKAFNALESWRVANAPKIDFTNVYEGKRDTRARGVQCIETGETWATLGACAEAHKLGKGNLSNHLAGHIGFKTVRGKTYRWI